MSGLGLNSVPKFDPLALVAISQKQIKAIASMLQREFDASSLQPAKWSDPLFWNIDAPRSERCQFLAIGNAINFRFWRLADDQLISSAGLIEGQSFRGSMYMWRRLRVAVSRGEFQLDAEWLRELTDETFECAFRDDDGVCPLTPGLAERVENLRDLGRRLLNAWQGEFVGVVDAAKGSLRRFTKTSGNFRAFDDPVQKLTMVNAIMLSGSGLIQFDQEPLPGIDYHLVKQVLRQGVVVPSKRLQEKISARQFLTPEESLALRKATLAALMQIAEVSEISTAIIDNIYWSNGKICDERHPACKQEGAPVCPFQGSCYQHVELGIPLELTRYY